MAKRQIPMFAALENNVKGEIEMKIALIVLTYTKFEKAEEQEIKLPTPIGL